VFGRVEAGDTAGKETKTGEGGLRKPSRVYGFWFWIRTRIGFTWGSTYPTSHGC